MTDSELGTSAPWQIFRAHQLVLHLVILRAQVVKRARKWAHKLNFSVVRPALTTVQQASADSVRYELAACS